MGCIGLSFGAKQYVKKTLRELYYSEYTARFLEKSLDDWKAATGKEQPDLEVHHEAIAKRRADIQAKENELVEYIMKNGGPSRPVLARSLMESLRDETERGFWR